MRALLAQARSVLRVAQAVSDGLGVVEKALLRERPPHRPKLAPVREVTEEHILFHQYNGYWPTNGRELAEFTYEMGFDEE